jgi:Ca2+-binding RTX toxin-like protein
VSPVALNPILGTTGDDAIAGMSASDKIEGLGGNDTISGSTGDDIIYAGSASDPNTAGVATIFGDGGYDTIYGGAEYNILNGSNDSLMGVGERDTLIGNPFASNLFILGTGANSYYASSGNIDYVSIPNFTSGIDSIQLAGSTDDYLLTFANGVNSLFVIQGASTDLIAKINTATPLSLGIDFSFPGA